MAWRLQFPESVEFLPPVQSQKPLPRINQQKVFCNYGYAKLFKKPNSEAFLLKVPTAKKQITLRLASDTGFNLIKRGSVPKEAVIKIRDCAELKCENGRLISLGTVIIDIFGRPAKFRVISDDHQLREDGILGAAFFHEAKVAVCYETQRVFFIDLTIENRQSFVMKTEAIVKMPDNLTKRLFAIMEAIDFSWNTFEEREYIIQLVSNYRELFYLPGDKLSVTNAIKCEIKLTDDTPFATPTWRKKNSVKNEEMKKQVEALLKDGIIRRSRSKWNSPCQLKLKDTDSNGNKIWRFIMSCTELKNRMEKKCYKMPRVKDILTKLGGSSYFTIVDLASTSYQIPIEPKDRAKTAFSTGIGKFEFNRMPIGIKNGSETIQEMMDGVLKGLESTFVFRDDMIVFSKSLEEHKSRVSALFDRLAGANLMVQTSKCKFFTRKVKYLGEIVTARGFLPDPDKVTSVLQLPQPRNKEQVQQLLNKVYPLYRYIQNLANVIEPLSRLTATEEQEFIWEEDQKSSHESLLHVVKNIPLLIHANYKKPFVLTVGATEVAIQASLTQKACGIDTAIEYFSRPLTLKEKKYSGLEREACAIIQAVQHFSIYLSGHRFQLQADREAFERLQGISTEPVMTELREEFRNLGWQIVKESDAKFSLQRC